MWRTNRLAGFVPSGWAAFLGNRIPSTPARLLNDPRLNPATGGGRRLIHPYLADIIYPENPTTTHGFDFDAVPRVRPVLSRMAAGTALVKYADSKDDVLISEVWNAGSLSTNVEFVRQLLEYFTDVLPTGDYIGWHPRDRSPYNYFVDLVNLQIGAGDVYHLEEIHSNLEPLLIAEPVTMTFKLIRDNVAPSGALTFLGY